MSVPDMVNALPGLATLNDFFFQLGIFFGYATAAGINKSFLFKIKKANVCEMFGYRDSVGYLFDCGLYKTGKVFQC